MWGRTGSFCVAHVPPCAHLSGWLCLSAIIWSKSGTLHVKQGGGADSHMGRWGGRCAAAAVTTAETSACFSHMYLTPAVCFCSFKSYDGDILQHKTAGNHSNLEQPCIYSTGTIMFPQKISEAQPFHVWFRLHRPPKKKIYINCRQQLPHWDKNVPWGHILFRGKFPKAAWRLRMMASTRQKLRPSSCQSVWQLDVIWM